MANRHKNPLIGWNSADPTLKPWLEAEAARRGITRRELLDEALAGYRERRGREMSDFDDMTAAELAEFLRDAGGCSTVHLAMLDEATIDYRRKSPHLARAQQAFAESRRACMGTGVSGEAWDRMAAAAGRLAKLLKPLGDFRIARCKRPAGWGTCNLALDDDGECRSSLGHTDDAASNGDVR